MRWCSQKRFKNPEIVVKICSMKKSEWEEANWGNVSGNMSDGSHSTLYCEMWSSSASCMFKANTDIGCFQEAKLTTLCRIVRNAEGDIIAFFSRCLLV